MFFLRSVAYTYSFERIALPRVYMNCLELINYVNKTDTALLVNDFFIVELVFINQL